MFSKIKGWIGEKGTQLGMWLKLDDDVYKRFHNIIIETRNGTTQIDHVVLSKYGLFVIETKNYNGWIFGNKEQPYWTQNIYGTKNKFQNPLHQNYKHTMALSEHLKVDHGKIHSIVFFIGECELKSNFPPNVMSSGLSAYIQSFSSVVFSPREMSLLEAQLNEMKADNTISTKEHVNNLKKRYSSEAVCPKCGAELIKKTAKGGTFAGKEFIGCSRFPQCRYIKS